MHLIVPNVSETSSPRNPDTSPSIVRCRRRYSPGSTCSQHRRTTPHYHINIWPDIVCSLVGRLTRDSQPHVQLSCGCLGDIVCGVVPTNQVMVRHLNAEPQQPVSRYIVEIPVRIVFCYFVWMRPTRNDSILFVVICYRVWDVQVGINRSTSSYARVCIYQEYTLVRYYWVIWLQ